MDVSSKKMTIHTKPHRYLTMAGQDRLKYEVGIGHYCIPSVKNRWVTRSLNDLVTHQFCITRAVNVQKTTMNYNLVHSTTNVHVSSCHVINFILPLSAVGTL